MINITHSIPSDLSDSLGFSTLIVRVQDKSSKTENDFTYYTLVSIVTYIYCAKPDGQALIIIPVHWPLVAMH